MFRRLILLGLIATFSVFLAWPSAAQDRPSPSYVGSSACADCHIEEMAAWEGSHHAKAWTPTTPENILGDFDNAKFSLNGIQTRFYRDGDTFMIETDGPDGQQTRYPVHSVVGIEPLQQYLLETEPGKLQSFDVVWDTGAQRWYHLYPDDTLFAGDGMHWTGPYKNWNARCAECHATDFDKNYSPVTRSYASTQSEIGVGCEACHGPGEAHLAWANNQETSQVPWIGLTETGFTIDMSAGGETYIQQCASCHALREPFDDGNPLPGTAFHNAYQLNTLRPESYHPDGQILSEVYVYGSFLQSKMYAKGVTCNNCHEPHSVQLRTQGNGVCTQCHSEVGNTGFPTLTLKSYDDPSHHFHELGTEGAQCKSCHMIERNYMVVDGRRDHSFRIPRPDLSVESRSPNACNDCHSDQSAAWAASIAEDWYPESTHRATHYGQTFAAAQNDPRGSVDDLVDLAGYDALPGIARASALNMLAPLSTPDIATRLAPLLEDEDPLIRAAAVAVQRGAPLQSRTAQLVPLLADPSKSVRIAVAREFLSLRVLDTPERISGDLNGAMQDWQNALDAKTDFPETQMVLAGIGLTTRRMDMALQAFGEAVELDPQLIQAWIMIVRIHSALGDNQAALKAVDSALEANPDSVDLNLIRAELL
jgi:predicted CXXCH cytochrome family protein